MSSNIKKYFDSVNKSEIDNYICYYICGVFYISLLLCIFLLTVADVKMEIKVLFLSLKPSNLNSSIFQLDKTCRGMGSAFTVEQSWRKANVAAQGHGKFGPKILQTKKKHIFFSQIFLNKLRMCKSHKEQPLPDRSFHNF